MACHLLQMESSHLILHLNQKESQRDRRFPKSGIFLPCADGISWQLWFHRGLRPNQHKVWRNRAGYRRSTKAHAGFEWMRPRVAEECAEADHRWSLVITSWRIRSFRRWPRPPCWYGRTRARTTANLGLRRDWFIVPAFVAVVIAVVSVVVYRRYGRGRTAI